MLFTDSNPISNHTASSRLTGNGGLAINPMDNLLGALGNTGAAGGALGVIDNSNIVDQGNGLLRAVAHAHAAGNAACLAGFHHSGALVLVGAQHRWLRGHRLQADDMVRAGCHTGGAAGALFAVHNSAAVYHMDSVKLAGAGAVAIAQAAKCTGAGTAGNGSSSGTGGNAVVFKAGATVAVAAVAVYNGVQGRATGALSAHNGVDSLGGFGTAGGALIGGCAVFNNRFCIVLSLIHI